MAWKRMAAGLAVLALLGGCATGRLSDQERLALYRQHAGEPVRDLRIYGSGLSGWTELGQSALAVWTRPNEAYLLELTGPCYDLDYAPAISITNQMGVVSARFDRVIVLGGAPGMRMPCRIDRILPLDVKALKLSEKELREAKTEAREEGAGDAR